MTDEQMHAALAEAILSHPRMQALLERQHELNAMPDEAAIKAAVLEIVNELDESRKDTE